MKRPYLVLPGGDCVPLEGAYRIEALQGGWYVLGRNRAIPCASRAEAETALARAQVEHDAHALAEEALFEDVDIEWPDALQTLASTS